MTQTDTFKESRKTLSPLFTLIPYLAKHRKKVIAALLALVTAAAVLLVLPVSIRLMIDNGFSSSSASHINDYFSLIIAVIIIMAIAGSLRYYFVMWIGERVVQELRADVFQHLTTLGADFFDKEKSGELVSRLSADTTLIKSAFGASASIALRQFLTLLGAITMMVITSSYLSFIALIAIPCIVLPLLAFGRMLKSRSRTAQDSLATAMANASEVLSGMRTIQAYNNEQYATTSFRSKTQEAFAASLHAIRARSVLIGTIIIVVASSIVGILWVGASEVVSNDMSGGELTQFLIYAIMAAGAVSELSQVWGELTQAAGAAERLSELLALPSSITAPAKPEQLTTPAKGNIEFQQVGFAYPGARQRPILNNMSLTIQPGETIALVGPSGAGKSTLFQLLMRYYDPNTGYVALDGIKLHQLSPQNLRDQIALVPQDTTIFGSSIAENIALANPEATRADIEQAAKHALAHDFISALPEGYDTIVGERGMTLSGGQRQRIAIARALLKNAPVLLLDEATSALDAESEKLVQKALDQLMIGRTTLIIAHRLSTVLKADRILVIDGGKLVEAGTHAELVKHDGIYAKLAKMQFKEGAQAINESLT
ncbi:ABC transporter transmembrane domain-containing protein [Polycladidibacter stylochi]|uniref:ABC transporter transmembrane domain-containing protein n=1 Tax=Polycladidibacter stylochi TaxID=1807766 RepID=UPI0009EB930E|nr:ABC transporter transmembrane domain-containing protein [Pseudovibrio stylochi]